MKIIMNVEIREGYPKWKELFDSADEARKKYGIKVLAYGHPKDNEYESNARSYERSRNCQSKNRCWC